MDKVRYLLECNRRQLKWYKKYNAINIVIADCQLLNNKHQQENYYTLRTPKFLENKTSLQGAPKK